MPSDSAVTQSQFDDLKHEFEHLVEKVDEIHDAVVSPQHGGLVFQLHEIRHSIESIEQKLSAQGGAAAPD